jgi:hypothetical protein
MLAKCANSSCSASFLHLRDGRLCRLETEPAFASTNAKATEYFWLCGPCSAGMTLHLVEDGTVAAIGLADTLCNGPPSHSTRETGRMVHSFAALAFFPEAIRKAHENLSGERYATDIETSESIIDNSMRCIRSRLQREVVPLCRVGYCPPAFSAAYANPATHRDRCPLELLQLASCGR